jgi:hypothetical protein
VTDAPDTKVVDPATVLDELRESARALDAAADELRKVTTKFEGYQRLARDDDGQPVTDDATGEPVLEFVPGPSLLWRELVDGHLDGHLDRIATAYEDQGKRPPAKEVLEARARKAAKEENTDLWADYHALAARMTNLQKWISAKRETISARQSWLRAHGVLTGFR